MIVSPMVSPAPHRSGKFFGVFPGQSGLRHGYTFLLACLVLLTCAAAQDPGPAGKLQVYFIDVEGGQSTLFVTPDMHSLLIDTGWPGNDHRDADRIHTAAENAGITRIDYVLLTHYHVDHAGGVPQLVERIPVGAFIDHGPNRETGSPETENVYEAYQKVLATGKYRHIVPQPGDLLPIPGLSVRVISSDGNLISKPLPGGGQPNPYCKESETRPPDPSENARSLGTLITFGKFRILDLGDLTWAKEMQLMCPNNPIGRVDVLVVSHHGISESSSPALIDAVDPQVTIMNNGATKGGSRSVIDAVAKIPGIQGTWQLHKSDAAGPDNPPDRFLANVEKIDTGFYLRLLAAPDGHYSVYNSRNGMIVDYTARSPAGD